MGLKWGPVSLTKLFPFASLPVLHWPDFPDLSDLTLCSNRVKNVPRICGTSAFFVAVKQLMQPLNPPDALVRSCVHWF
jgi:hypothetical protein